MRNNKEEIKSNKRLTNKPNDTTQLLDNELVQLAVESGNNQYYGELYSRYNDKVYGKCILMLKDATIAQDCTQDILVKAFTKLGTFKGKSNFSTWLFQVTYTHCIDYIRKNKNIFKEELEEDRYDQLQAEDPEIYDLHDKELLEYKIAEIESIMAELKTEEQELMLMKYTENRSINELCESLELSPSAIKMKLMRTRDKIRERYFELNPV